jgi:hypothetical protein
MACPSQDASNCFATASMETLSTKTQSTLRNKKLLANEFEQVLTIVGLEMSIRFSFASSIKIAMPCKPEIAA